MSILTNLIIHPAQARSHNAHEQIPENSGGPGAMPERVEAKFDGAFSGKSRVELVRAIESRLSLL
jgi:hypothetical protein